MKSFDKVLANANKKKAFSIFWSKNGYKIMRVLLFPFYWATLAQKKIKEILYNKKQFSTKQAKHILDKYLPECVTRRWMLDENGGFLVVYSDFVNELDAIEIGGFTYGVSSITRKMRKKSRQFVGKFSTQFYEYVRDEYQILGWEKFIGNSEGFIEVCSQYRPWSPNYTVGAIYFKKGVDK